MHIYIYIYVYTQRDWLILQARPDQSATACASASLAPGAKPYMRERYIINLGLWPSARALLIYTKALLHARPLA